MTERKKAATYSPMGKLCTDYEPFSGTSPFPGYQGFHCHDFFEFIVFFSGAPYHSLGGQISPLSSCTLVIIPPFHMHGLIKLYPRNRTQGVRGMSLVQTNLKG